MITCGRWCAIASRTVAKSRMSPIVETMPSEIPAATNRLGSVAGASARPATSQPMRLSQLTSQPPVKPVCPVTNTRAPRNASSKSSRRDSELMFRTHGADLRPCRMDNDHLKEGRSRRKRCEGEPGRGPSSQHSDLPPLARMGHAMKAFSGDGLMDTGSLFFDPELSRLTTGRTTSLFAQDIKAQDAALRSAFAGRRILVTGGAGSIGSATLELLFPYAPAAVHVIDLAENGLVELVRDFRSRPEPLVRGEFRLLPIDYGSAATERLLQSERPYDLVLHFAAHKHVRSEKDVPSVIQMLDTN